MRRFSLGLALLATATAIAPTFAAQPAGQPPPPDAKQLVALARELWHTYNDYNGALDAFNRAVDAAPEDMGIRLDRGLFFENVADMVREEEKEKYKDLARADYAEITESEPDTTRAGIARDGLTRIAGTELVQPKQVACPDEAVEAHDRAESFYGARRMDDAIVEYQRAIAACPASAWFLVDYADAYYAKEDYAKAKELFTKALAIDPWNRSGHRFLADTHANLREYDDAVHQAALAVASDPIYEAAWASLRGLAGTTDRDWRRVYGKKTGVTASTGDGGKSVVTISLPADDSAAKTKEKRKGKKAKGKKGSEDPTTDSDGWMYYGIFKASALGGIGGDDAAPKLDAKTASALEIERMAVEITLKAMRERGEPSAAAAPFWSMMDRAERAGYLDEAIFLHMLDEPLAKEYPAFRDDHRDRLTAYLENVVVPKR